MGEYETWKERVAEWKASGLKASEYCAGRDFEAKTLYRWAAKLKPGAETEEGETGPVRVARVVLRKRVGVAPSAAVSIELGGARVVVPPGADSATLSRVLEALGAWAARRAR